MAENPSPMQPNQLRYDLDHVRLALSVLYRPGDVGELRIPNVKGRMMVAGYFDDSHKLAENAARYSGKVGGVYVTLNPCKPELLARAHNRVIEWANTQTADHDILRRIWLPVDFDPVRPAGISSTDAQHQAAHHRALACRDSLARELGFPDPVRGDSGNGAHLLYGIDLPNDEASRDLMKACLQALSLWFGDDDVSLDTGNFNASRIWKLFGTLAAKGDHTAERPHRLARMLDVPEQISPVTLKRLQALAALVPQPEGDRVQTSDRTRAGSFNSNNSPYQK